MFLRYVAFQIVLYPNVSFDNNFYAKYRAEIKAINLFFPDIKSNSVGIPFTAWLSFICVFDDSLE